jgi:aspartate/methionine/tyrosine aminotransferase
MCHLSHVFIKHQSYVSDKGALIPLSQAVPGYPPPDLMLEELGAAASDPAFLDYDSIEGESVLRSTYTQDLEYTHGSVVPAEQIMITSGCNQTSVKAALTPNIRAMVIVTPNNPTGTSC